LTLLAAEVEGRPSLTMPAVEEGGGPSLTLPSIEEGSIHRYCQCKLGKVKRETEKGILGRGFLEGDINEGMCGPAQMNHLARGYELLWH
jgi:hypothetical protein